MALSNTALQTLYTSLKGMGAYVSAHTADPGTTGANEVSGGSYARQSAALPAGSNGAGTAPAVNIPIPAGTTVKWIGVWTAATGGTFVGAHTAELSPNLPFTVAGTLTVQVGEVITSTP